MRPTITHLTSSEFKAYKLLKSYGGGKSGALVYRAAHDNEAIKRTVAVKLYMDAFDVHGHVHNNRPFREVDTQCRLSGRSGFNCLLGVYTLDWKTVKDRIFDTEYATRTDIVHKLLPQDTIDTLSVGTDGKPTMESSLCCDDFTSNNPIDGTEGGNMTKTLLPSELPYVPSEDHHKVLMMVTDWTSGDPLSRVDMSTLGGDAMVGTFLQLCAVWNDAYTLFRKSDKFAHWDLHPDNIFIVNDNTSCDMRPPTHIPVGTLLETLRSGLSQVVRLHRPRGSVWDMLEKELVTVLDTFVSVRLLRGMYDVAKKDAATYIRDSIQHLETTLRDALRAKLATIPVPDRLMKKPVNVVHLSIEQMIHAVSVHVQTFFRHDGIHIRYPRVVVIDFDLVTSEKLFRLEIEHAGKLKSMLPVTERALAFVLAHLSMEVGLAWVRTLSALFQSFKAEHRPYYLVDFNHLLTYLLVFGSYYVQSQTARGVDRSAACMAALVRTGMSMCRAVRSHGKNVMDLLHSPRKLFLKLVRTATAYHFDDMLTMVKETSRRLGTGLEDTMWATIGSVYGVTVDAALYRNVRNVLLGRASVVGIMTKHLGQLVGIDGMDLHNLTRMFVQNYVQHVAHLSWTKSGTFPNQDSLSLLCATTARTQKRATYSDFTVVFNTSTAIAVDAMVRGQNDTVREMPLPSYIAVALSYKTNSPPTLRVSLVGGSDVHVAVQGRVAVHLGMVDIPDGVPSLYTTDLLQPWAYARGGIRHSHETGFVLLHEVARTQKTIQTRHIQSDNRLTVGIDKVDVQSSGNTIVATFDLDTGDVNTIVPLLKGVVALLAQEHLPAWLVWFGRFVRPLSGVFATLGTTLGVLSWDNVMHVVQSKFNEMFADKPIDIRIRKRDTNRYFVKIVTVNTQPHPLMQCVQSLVTGGSVSDALDCLSYLFPVTTVESVKTIAVQDMLRLLAREMVPWMGTATVHLVHTHKRKEYELALVAKASTTYTKTTRTVTTTLLPQLIQDPWMDDDVVMHALTYVLMSMDKAARANSGTYLTQLVEAGAVHLPTYLGAILVGVRDTTRCVWTHLIRVWNTWMSESARFDSNYMFFNPAHSAATLKRMVLQAITFACAELIHERVQYVVRRLQRVSSEPTWKVVANITESDILAFKQNCDIANRKLKEVKERVRSTVDSVMDVES